MEHEPQSERLGHKCAGLGPGTLVDHFKIMRLLGRGGMLVVGYSDGNIELVPADPNEPRPSYSFEQVPASELGSTLVWDLSAFYLDDCALLRDVWQQVPVVWGDGRPVARKPPSGHRCSP